MAETTVQAALDRLNPAQKTAAMNTSGPMLIVAGAGSGKTSVLTARIALLLSQGVRPERILALTFTKKAAEEMRSRVTDMCGEPARRLCMGTFHSVFARFLRANAERVYYPSNFTILDEEDSESALKRCIDAVLGAGRPPREEWTEMMAKTYEEEDSRYKVKLVKSVVSDCKNRLVTADMYAEDRETADRDALSGRTHLARIYKEYRDLCHRMAVMDFDDILLYMDMLLNNCPDVLASLAGSFDYILVDEYQDTNAAQYSILRRLTWINRNICVVGDDSQSIYAFRGARIQNIFSFRDDYPGCAVVKLEQNYRSTRSIVDAANNLISHNANRIPKVCFSSSETGRPVRMKECETESHEAAYIAATIKGKMATEGMRSGDFAVLYRTNAQSRVLEDALVKARIPYTVCSGTSFFERAEIKDMMAYLKLAVNPNDDESFRRVANKPARGFGDSAMKKLVDLASERRKSLWDTVTDPDARLDEVFARKAWSGLSSFVRLMKRNIGTALEKEASAAVVEITDACGLAAMLDSAGDRESKGRADNIRELASAAGSFEEDVKRMNLDGDLPEPSDLQAFLQNVMLMTGADKGESPDGRVSLMTVHSAKGLEFPCVFLAGMESGVFPLANADEEEERRLCYVAVTRAKKQLIITGAKKRMRYGKRKEMKPSYFLAELAQAMPEISEDKTLFNNY